MQGGPEVNQAPDYLRKLRIEQQRAQKLAALAKEQQNKHFKNNHLGVKDGRRKTKFR